MTSDEKVLASLHIPVCKRIFEKQAKVFIEKCRADLVGKEHKPAPKEGAA